MAGDHPAGASPPAGPAARIRAARRPRRVRLGARGLRGRGPGRGRPGPGTASPPSRHCTGRVDRHADGSATRAGTVQGHGPALLPAVRPAGSGPPLSRPDRAAGRRHSRNRDLADTVCRARAPRHPAGPRQCPALCEVRGALPAPGLAVSRNPVARHPDRRADARRCRAFSPGRRTGGARAGFGQHQVRPRDSAGPGRGGQGAACGMGCRAARLDCGQHARRRGGRGTGGPRRGARDAPGCVAAAGAAASAAIRLGQAVARHARHPLPAAQQRPAARARRRGLPGRYAR